MCALKQEAISYKFKARAAGYTEMKLPCIGTDQGTKVRCVLLNLVKINWTWKFVGFENKNNFFLFRKRLHKKMGKNPLAHHRELVEPYRLMRTLKSWRGLQIGIRCAEVMVWRGRNFVEKIGKGQKLNCGLLGRRSQRGLSIAVKARIEAMGGDISPDMKHDDDQIERERE